MTGPKPFVFVLMPFAGQFDDIYQLGIKAACVESGAHCERVDEQIFEGSILERIYNQIAKADVVIADLTGKNPNVFYETGYAHALGKRVVLLTQDSGDIPFDMKHFPHLIYGGRIGELKQQLTRRLRYLLAAPNRSLEEIASSLRVFHEGQEINDREIEYRAGRYESVLVLKLDISNPTGRTIGPTPIALITSDAFSREHTISLPDGRWLHSLPELTALMPEAWTSIRIILKRKPVGRVERQQIYSADPSNLTFRLYTTIGPQDANFRIRYSDPNTKQRGGAIATPVEPG